MYLTTYFLKLKWSCGVVEDLYCIFFVICTFGQVRLCVRKKNSGKCTKIAWPSPPLYLLEGRCMVAFSEQLSLIKVAIFVWYCPKSVRSFCGLNPGNCCQKHQLILRFLVWQKLKCQKNANAYEKNFTFVILSPQSIPYFP